MGRRTWRQDEDRLRTAALDDVVRVSDVVELGVSREVVYDRCRPGGPWQLVLPGTVLLHSGRPTERQVLRSALVYSGPDAVLTGATAAGLYGLRTVEPGRDVRLLIPHAKRRRSVGFAVVERTHRIPEPLAVRGFPCVPVVRAVLDHARTLRARTAVQAVLAEVVQRRFCTAEALLEELDAGSGRGSALVRTELDDVLGGARSVAEIRAKRIARRSGLPEPQWNVVLENARGEAVGRPDAWWDDVGLAWEIDSYEFHFDPEGHARTLRRNARYAMNGVPVVPTLPSRLLREEQAVITELVAAHVQAGRGPRPNVSVRAA